MVSQNELKSQCSGFSNLAADSSQGQFILNSVRLLLTEAIAQSVTNLNHQAYILATARHESGLGIHMHELGGDKYFTKLYENRADLGNNQPGDGARYHGRGFVQITGRGNYRTYSNLFGIDLVGNPDLATQPPTAARIMVNGMKFGRFTGVGLAKYDLAGDDYDFFNARRIVNGTDKAELIAGYARQYLSWLKAVAQADIVGWDWLTGGESDDFNLTRVSYQVTITDNANVRSGPGTSFGKTRLITPNASRVYTVDAEATGESISGDNIWLRLPEAGGFVSHTLVKEVLTPIAYQVAAHDKINVRSGPSTSHAVITMLNPDPAHQFQVDGELHGEMVGADDVWSHLPTVGGYVSRGLVEILN